MRKILALALLATLGLSLATPAFAGHRDRYRGQSVRVVRGGYHTVRHSAPPWRRHRAGVFFGFGVPLFAPAPVYVYDPAPILVAPGYCAPVWVPGHYVRDRGARIWVAGYWSR